jgi:hypothetical protein
VILVLHGAKKNVGDFLIHDRGRKLLEHVLPDKEFLSLPRWEPLKAEQLASAEGIVLCGGPGLASNFYPGVFPLVDNLGDLDIPILPLALGWSGRPADRPGDFTFDAPSLDALRVIHERVGWSSTRDDLTQEIMVRSGFANATRTGCVAWYHVPHLGVPLRAPSSINRFVVTPPAAPRFARETIGLMRQLRRRYPKAERYCVFHRGLQADQYTPRKHSLVARVTAAAATALGYKVVDASYDLQKIDFYGDVDLHVGYRVHAASIDPHLRRRERHRAGPNTARPLPARRRRRPTPREDRRRTRCRDDCRISERGPRHRRDRVELAADERNDLAVGRSSATPDRGE